jgi:toxin FitB
MDKKYIIDTNIIIYYLDNKIPDSQLKNIETIFIETFNISTVTKIELLGWHKIDNKTKSKIEKFISNSDVFILIQLLKVKLLKLNKNIKSQYQML